MPTTNLDIRDDGDEIAVEYTLWTLFISKNGYYRFAEAMNNALRTYNKLLKEGTLNGDWTELGELHEYHISYSESGWFPPCIGIIKRPDQVFLEVIIDDFQEFVKEVSKFGRSIGVLKSKRKVSRIPIPKWSKELQEQMK